MLKKILFSIPLLPLLINAQTLTDITGEIIRTNPEIREKIYYYNSLKEEYDFAKSGYRPTIDLAVSFGREHTNSPSTKRADLKTDGLDGLGLYKAESSLQLVQNIFKGFQTENEVEAQKAKFMSASFDILDKTDSIALSVAQSYINVLKYKEMVSLAKENIKTHKKILVQIKAKVDSGFSPRSDMLQVQTRYTLAESNLITQQSNLENELIKFHKLLGRFMDKKEFVLPKTNFELPTNIDKATATALEVNPAIKVTNYNVKRKKFEYEKEKKGYYPSVDFLLKAEKNKNTSAIEGTTNRYYAGIKLQYNLFNGFADEASIQKNVSLVNQENSLRNKIRRQIIESVRLAWSSYDSFVKKEKILKEHVDFANQARGAYAQEFLIAKRTLLDILSIEGEYNNAKKSHTENYYAMLYTQYQLMDAMGTLIEELGLGDSKYIKSIDAKTDKDRLPLDLEADKDSIVDMKDICDETVNPMDINEYGCIDIVEDDTPEVKDEMVDIAPIQKVEERYIPKPILKKRNLKDEKEKHSLEKEVIYFKYKSSVISQNSVKILDRVVNIMKKEINLRLELSAYTDSLASKRYNKKLSLSRAIIVKKYLVNEGIEASRIDVYGKGEESPIASNDTKEGRAKNRRVEISFISNEKRDKDIELEPINFDVEEVDEKDIDVGDNSEADEVSSDSEYDPEDVNLEQIEIDF